MCCCELLKLSATKSLIVLGAENVHLERLPGRTDVSTVRADKARREHVAGLDVLPHDGLVDGLVDTVGAGKAALLIPVVHPLDQAVQLGQVCNNILAGSATVRQDSKEGMVLS